MLVTNNRVEFFKDEEGNIHEIGYSAIGMEYKEIHQSPVATTHNCMCNPAIPLPECYFMFHYSSRLQFEVH